MLIESLYLKNIGPFKEANIEFPTQRDEEGRLPVTIITGENGTGKTIVLDAIRGVLYGRYGSIERNIINQNKEFEIKILLSANTSIDETKQVELSTSLWSNGIFRVSEKKKGVGYKIDRIFNNPPSRLDWILMYWTSRITNDSYIIRNIVAPEPKSIIKNALIGVQRNAEITELITYFDYLSDSKDPNEKKLGQFMFNTISKMLQDCLNNGEFAYVSRTQLKPIVRQNGQEVSLEQLSSGNLFLMQRLIGLLGKMYAVATLNSIPLENMLEISGILMIDEAETHLHPHWQKTFIEIIQKFFPKLQIILTTHSPFIVASVDNPKVLVCESRVGYSELVDRSEDYANKPIDEILVSPVFGTQPYSQEITFLLEKRKQALREGKQEEVDAIEAKLVELNPQHFSYFNLERELRNMNIKTR